MSIDGVDFRTKGKKLLNGKPDTSLYSHKFKGPGYRYEIGLCILTSDICWLRGPFKPGLWNDLTIFRAGLKMQLDDGERVEADNGYMGESPHYCKCPDAYTSSARRRRMVARVRNRHESVNSRLKIYGCLTTSFRHGIEKHGWCVRAIAVLTQLAMENGEELFDVSEYEDGVTDVDVAILYGL